MARAIKSVGALRVMAHQVAARMARGTVAVVPFRDRVEGGETYGVAYSAGERWLSPQRFTDQAQADAAAAVLASFLGVEVRP